MNDSLETLALSCTFAMLKGKMAQVEEVGPDAPLSLRPDVIVDSKYRVIELIGEGGMGSVYKVHHELLQKDMALKTICARSLSSEAWQRFQREAQAVAKLRHKNIVEVFDFGIADGQLPYYTMELLEGETLAQRLTRLGPCDAALALNIFIQVAEAMAYAHRQKVVHRDIKPANILLAQSYASKASVQAAGEAPVPVVKIVDFGVSKLATEAPLDNQYLTRAGTIFGSPLYMSPEQSIGGIVDQRSDIYSFGCALFHALTGRPPFVGENAFLTLAGHQVDMPPALRDVNPSCQCTQRLDSTMAKLLAKDPVQRFQTFEEVRDELSYCLGALKRLQHTTASGVNRDSVKSNPVGPEETKTEHGRSISKVRTATVAFCLGVALIALLALQVLKPIPLATKPDAATAMMAKPSLTQGHKLTNRTALVPFPVQLDRAPSGETKTFTFPEGENDAIIYYDAHPDNISCSGKVTVPLGARLYLIGIQGLGPDFIRRFRADDLFDIHLKERDDGEWSDAHMEAISHLSGLKRLDISESDLDGRAIPFINKLSNLKKLKVTNTKISGEALAKLKVWRYLTTLSASGLKGIPFFLKRIPVPCRLKSLQAANDGLKDEDMPLIGQMIDLDSLSLEGNDLTARGVTALRPLSLLTMLSLGNMEPDCIEPLSHFKHLGTLHITPATWSPSQRQELQRLLPKCKIEYRDTQVKL
jgi:serine/threonine protein kinase